MVSGLTKKDDQAGRGSHHAEGGEGGRITRPPVRTSRLALEDAKRFDEALASYDECMRLSPDFADAHYNAARLHEMLGHKARAIRHYSEYRRLQR